MKLSKLLKRLNHLLASQDHEIRTQRDELSKTLKKLKEKSLDLEQRISACEDTEKKKELEEKLAILQSKRRKGVALAKELKQPE